MEAIRAYKLASGELFECHDEAKRAAENAYGRALSSMAHRLCRIDKYKDACDFVDSNLAEFGKLALLKHDAEHFEDNSGD